MALAAQALDAQKARKPLEQGGALEQVGARMKRVMGLTLEVSGTHRQRAARCTIIRAPCGALPVRVRLDRPVRPHRPLPGTWAHARSVG